MGISVFPSGGGEFITNDFVIDMADTSNNVVDLGRSYASGAYDISLASGDTSFDIYALDSDGESVGYTNDATLVASEQFVQVVILGVSTTERITFAFSGASNDPDSEGDATGAGAYLTSINPSDLPTVDDTATVEGGNFAEDVEIYFESGSTSTEAKNVVRSDSTSLVVTRPDELDPSLDPWDVRAVNPGIQQPVGSDAHILAGAVDAGASPVWVTTSPLPSGIAGQSYSVTLEATDADGAVEYSITAGTLQAGLSLDSSTGVLSGTPTESQPNITVTASDEGGNSNSREFVVPIQLATGGTVTNANGYTIHTFLTSDDFVALADIPNLEYFAVGGGAAGGARFIDNDERMGGGGGGGGIVSSITGDPDAASPVSITAGTYAIAVGAGGAATSNTRGANGGDSIMPGVITALGGGGGGHYNQGVSSEGTGGGGAERRGAGNGTAGMGGDGKSGSQNTGGGGGAGHLTLGDANGTSGAGGYESVATGTATFYGGGGGGGAFNSSGGGGIGGGGGGNDSGTDGLGGGGTGGHRNRGSATSGGNGIVIVRY